MKYLLDTHTLIWWHDSPDLLSEKVLALCEDINNQLFLSMVSIWEMQIKLQLKKLTLTTSLADMVTLQQNNGISILPITIDHIVSLDTIPLHHKDPFDRLVIAQATIENAILLSKDTKFQLYPVQTAW
ncbi:MAG: PIN domain nuclease [Methylobacter sp.]|nr:MAG: PIN domain nuclease [Methylobacter sp.]